MLWEQMTCPECGEPVSATLETVEGEALLQEDGLGGYCYQGTTNIFWDNQETVKKDGKDCLRCENHHEWYSRRIEQVLVMAEAVPLDS